MLVSGRPPPRERRRRRRPPIVGGGCCWGCANPMASGGPPGVAGCGPRGRRRRDLIWGPYLVRAAVPVRDPGPRVAGSRAGARVGRACGRRVPGGGGGARVTPAGAAEGRGGGPPAPPPPASCPAAAPDPAG